MILRGPRDTTVVVSSQWLIEARIQMGSCQFFHAKDPTPILHSSQFYITFKPTPHLDKKHTVFGQLVGGEGVLDTLEKLPRKDGSERPIKQVKITKVEMYILNS